MARPQFETANRLLTSLSPADLALLTPALEPVTLALRQSMEVANRPIASVYFMESGIASVVAKSNSHRQVEAGIIGREGMSGVMVVMGNHRSPNDTFIQVAGSGQKIAADDLRRAMDQSLTLLRRLLRYAQAFMILTTHTALANGTANIEERLARWLLMTQDRLESDHLPLTHEFLSVMLAVRRPGVTDALRALEGRGLIRRLRGHVVIIDRPGLEDQAASNYGVPESEYDRLLG